MTRFSGADGGELEIQLARAGTENYELLESFRYQDPEFGTITVPHDLDEFDTDLTSTPWFTTFIAPVLGEHIPAVLLHDALVGDPDKPTYDSREGHVIDEDDAARILGDAMRECGTPPVRRWIIWSATTVGAAFRRRPIRFVAWVAGLLTLTLVHAADIVDAADFVPWLGEWSFFAEWAVSTVAIALLLIVVGPLLLGLRYAKAAMVQGVIVALVFLPVLAMIPAHLLLVDIPERVRR